MLIDDGDRRLKAGVMLNEVSFANFPMIMRQAGMDFMILDTEHGGFDYSGMAALIMMAKQTQLPIIVRLADNEIGRASCRERV